MVQDASPNVLSLSPYDTVTGAGIVALELHRGLTELGCASRLLVKARGSEEPGVEELGRSRLGRWLLFQVQALERRTGYQYVLQPGSPGRGFEPALRDCDVLQLHNLHPNLVNPAAAARWSARKPVVWTLHDVWPITGHCAVSYDCERWLSGCGACPYPAEYPPLERDRTRFLWNWKRRVWAGAEFHLVCPSAWLAERVRRSPILGHRPVSVIPNPVDVAVFRPGDRAAARAELGIEGDAPVVAFAAGSARVERKGFPHLLAATQASRESGDLRVLVIGERDPAADGLPGVFWAGSRAPGADVARAFHAADFLCHPTDADVFGLVLAEAGACELPAVAFDVGGVSEVVSHGETGIVVPHGDRQLLAEAVRSLADDGERRRSMGERAKSRVESTFARDVVTRQYLALYERVRAVADGAR